MKLPDPRLQQAIEQALQAKMPPAGKRIFRLLAERGPRSTGRIAFLCQVGNVSDAVLHIQPILSQFGLFITNYPPSKPICNRFGGRSSVHIWEIVFLTKEGNE